MLKLTRSLTLNSLCAGVLLTVAGPLSALESQVTAKVLQVMVAVDDYGGGCMAKLSFSPHKVLPLCARDWVTMSCSGEYTEIVRAYRLLDQAQLALASGKSVTVWIQDDKTHDGYCLASRIDVLRY